MFMRPEELSQDNVFAAVFEEKVITVYFVLCVKMRFTRVVLGTHDTAT